MRNGAIPAVAVEALSKSFDSPRGRVQALSSMELAVAEGEVVALLGPSGCGKTTCLRSIAGLEQPDTGRIDIGDSTAFCSRRGINRPPEQRRLAMVFQSYALWPHMTVGANLAYPLSNLKLSRAETAERVRRTLEIVSCGHLIDRLPGQLSGGQQQRIALARAIAYEPRLLLFDEPLSNLDAKLREQMRVEIALLQRRLGFAAIYVTHDQAEAMTLADRIVIMDNGHILQVGTPKDIYENPATAFVAGFMGHVNFIKASRTARDAAETALGPVALDIDGPTGEVLLGVRPEHVAIVEADEADGPAAGTFPATIHAASYLGHAISYVVRLAEGVDWTLTGPVDRELTVGTPIRLRVPPGRWMAFPDDGATATRH